MPGNAGRKKSFITQRASEEARAGRKETQLACKPLPLDKVLKIIEQRLS
jgi:hypothetical protein